MCPTGKPYATGMPRPPKYCSQHFVEAEGAVTGLALHLGEAAHQHAGELAQCTHRPEVREHAIDPVERLSHVLEEEDRADEVGEESRADEALEQRQVAADQRPLGHALTQRHDAILPRGLHTGRLRQALEPSGRLRIAQHLVEVPEAELGHRVPRRGAMKGHHAGLLQRTIQQCRDVGIADDRLGALPQCREVDLLQDARHAVAAADAPHRVDRRIAQGRVEVGETIGIAPGEVAQPVADMRAAAPARGRAHGTTRPPG